MLSGSLDALNTPRVKPVRASSSARTSHQLDVSVGDRVELFTPQGTLTPVGPIPRPPRFKVVGTFSLGLYEFDSSYGFVPLEVAERMLGEDHADFIELRVDDMFAAQRGRRRHHRRSSAPTTSPQDWADMNESLFSALWLEKMAISITIGLIVMVAALNIVASLILLVMEKSRDIAILKTMGTSAASITADLHAAGPDHRASSARPAARLRRAR